MFLQNTITHSDVVYNVEYLLPQIGNINCLFLSEAKLPLVIRLPLVNFISSYKALINHEEWQVSRFYFSFL